MVYRLERRLSHADVDFVGELKVAALLGLLEQAAVEASTEAGFDPAWYAREGRMWIIRRTRLERFMPVGGSDTLEVETHVADFRRARSLRRYHVRRDGVIVAEATTDWVFCDVTSGRPMRIPEAMQQAFTGAAATMLPRAEALRICDDVPVEFSIAVQPSHLDHIAHVNNAVYASYLEDAAFALFATRGWPLARMLAAGGALRIRWLDFEYLSDAVASEDLTVRSWLRDETVGAAAYDPPKRATSTQTITRRDGNAVMRAESEWSWRRRSPVLGGAPT